MKEKHIIDIFEGAPFAGLSESELTRVRAHVESCLTCARAYEATQLAALLIKERAEEIEEPSPFFQTRVLAALRERQASVPAILRLWKSAGAVVTSMAATTVALAALSFFAPGAGTDVSAGPTAALIPSSAETVVLDQNQDDNQITDDQVLNAIYADEGAR